MQNITHHEYVPVTSPRNNSVCKIILSGIDASKDIDHFVISCEVTIAQIALPIA